MSFHYFLYKKFIPLAALIGICFLISKCSADNSGGITPEKNIHILLDEAKTDIWSYSDNIYSENGKEFLAFASSKSKTLQLVNIASDKVEISIPLHQIDSAFDFSYNKLKFFIHNLDSIFILPDESKSIFLIGRKGQIINNWDLGLKTDKYNFVLSGFYANPFAYYQGHIFIRYIPRIPTFGQKDEYFSILPELSIDIKNKNQITRCGGWPSEYRKENFYDSYPFLLVKENGSNVDLIYSFAAQHDLFIYREDNLYQKKSAKSDSINDFLHFPDDSIGNIAFTMKYLVTAPKYGKILYDKYRDLYYRIAYHKTGYLNTGGKTVKQLFDQPWSIIILDGNFKKIKEINFDETKFSPSPIYVIKDGLMIPKRNNKILDKYEWDFNVFNFSK